MNHDCLPENRTPNIVYDTLSNNDVQVSINIKQLCNEKSQGNFLNFEPWPWPFKTGPPMCFAIHRRWCITILNFINQSPVTYSYRAERKCVPNLKYWAISWLVVIIVLTPFSSIWWVYMAARVYSGTRTHEKPARTTDTGESTGKFCHIINNGLTLDVKPGGQRWDESNLSRQVTCTTWPPGPPFWKSDCQCYSQYLLP